MPEGIYSNVKEFWQANRQIEDIVLQQMFAQGAGMFSQRLDERKKKDGEENKLSELFPGYCKVTSGLFRNLAQARIKLLVTYYSTMESLSLEERIKWKDTACYVSGHANDLKKHVEENLMICSIDIEPATPQEVLELYGRINEQLKEFNLGIG